MRPACPAPESRFLRKTEGIWFSLADSGHRLRLLLMEGAARPYPVKRWSASRSEEEPCIRITEQNRGADGLWRGYRPEEVAKAATVGVPEVVAGLLAGAAG